MIMNKHRMSIKHNVQDGFSEQKSFLVTVAANHHNFQQILSVSKSFVAFSGFTYDFLLKNKMSVFLPKILDFEHEIMIKRFLKRGK